MAEATDPCRHGGSTRQVELIERGVLQERPWSRLHDASEASEPRSPAQRHGRALGLITMLFVTLLGSLDVLLARVVVANGATWLSTLFVKHCGMTLVQLAFALCRRPGTDASSPPPASGAGGEAAAPWRHLLAASAALCFANLSWSVATLSTSAIHAEVLFNTQAVWSVAMEALLSRRAPAINKLSAVGVVAAVAAVTLLGTSSLAPPAMAALFEGADRGDGVATSTLGDSLALISATLMSTFTTVSAATPASSSLDLVPAAANAGCALLIGAAAMGTGCRAEDLVTVLYSAPQSLSVLAMSVTEGFWDIGLQLALRHISSTEVGLCLLLEIIMSPLMVLLAFREAPATLEWLLACVMIGALAIHELLDGVSEAAAGPRGDLDQDSYGSDADKMLAEGLDTVAQHRLKPPRDAAETNAIMELEC